MIYFDFETRSEINLLETGAYKYSMHPSTHVLCFVYKIEDGPLKLWHRAHPSIRLKRSARPFDLIEALESGMIIEAHNASFENYIWTNTLRREFDWFPELPQTRWRCSAAKAAALSLPRKLELVAKACNLSTTKDEEGHRLMLKMCKPRKPLKGEIVQPGEILWHETYEQLKRLGVYCKFDVSTECELSHVTRDLSAMELEVWQMDQRMNARGVTCDLDLAHKALRLADEAKGILNARLREITGGRVPKGSNREKLKEWLGNNGLVLENTQGITVDKILDYDETLSDTNREVLEICRSVNKTSVSKYKAFIRQVSDDGRMRDTQLYHGSHTGRWTGKGIQLYNFVRGYGHGDIEEGIPSMDEVCDSILNLDAEALGLLYGDPIDVLSKAVRGALIASPGKKLMVADYSAIEARVLLWLALDEDGLDIFRRNEDIYVAMASTIFGKPINEITDAERFIGKQAILGLGYGMGGLKFLDEINKRGEKKFGLMCEQHQITEPLGFCKKVVKTYRDERFPAIRDYWRDTEEGAIRALKTRETVTIRRNKWGVRGRFLHCSLPSGRLLSYYKPLIQSKRSWSFPMYLKSGEEANLMLTTKPDASEYHTRAKAEKFAEEAGRRLIQGRSAHSQVKDSLTYMGTENGKYIRKSTYGGKEVENITQGTARDILIQAMLALDKHEDFDLLFSVYDETVTETDERNNNMKEYIKLVSKNPDWCLDLPLEAKGWEGQRYLK